MNSLFFLAALLSAGSAFAETKVRSLADIQKTLGAQEGSYELSAKGADPSGLCETQAADLEWIQTGSSVTLVIGNQLSFANLEVDQSKETDDQSCVSTAQNKVEAHRLIQSIENVCPGKASQNYTNKHQLDFSGDTITYTYDHRGPKSKSVKTTCLMKFLGPKGSRK